MRTPEELTKRVKVKTNILPTDLTKPEIDETARGIALFYKDDNFICQSFFTTPILGDINWIDGLDAEAQVHFREIQLIGRNLVHLRLVGNEDEVKKMCNNPKFFNLLSGISDTYTQDIKTKKYLDITVGKDRWYVIAALDRKSYYIANNVKLNGKKTRITNIIILGDMLLGLTDKREVVFGQLTPDVVEKSDNMLEVKMMDSVNKHGKIDRIEYIPNVEDSFLATSKNNIYQFNIWGDMVQFDVLDDNIKRINSIHFNNTRSIMATTDGLFEVDVVEMPNMVKANSLPRQIVNPVLKDNFKIAMYIEDPKILGIHPAQAIFAKTENEKVLFF